MRKIALTFDQLYDGYGKCIENAQKLWEAGIELVKQQPAIALGTFELGQEEIGKSFSFLAAFNHKSEDKDCWRIFWSEFSNHSIKAYRAHLYEIICPLRIHLVGDEKTFTHRGKINKEKEAALYVDFDDKKNAFTSPQTSIEFREAAMRGMTLLYLYRTAFYVKAGLDLETGFSKENSYRIFSEIPRRILIQEIYQQDFPNLITEFSGKSELHKQIAKNLDMALEQLKKVSYEEMKGRTNVIFD